MRTHHQRSQARVADSAIQAGVAPSQVGSVEFSAARYGTRLVVVLGHSQCGAILATVEELRRPTENQSANLRAIVDRVRPSVEQLLETDWRNDPEALVTQAVRANIRASVNHLRHGSQVLDYGAGAGAFSLRLQDLGYRVVAADVDADVEKAANLGASVIVAPADIPGTSSSRSFNDPAIAGDRAPAWDGRAARSTRPR